VSPVKYEMDIYNPEDDILHSHRRENLKVDINIYEVAGRLKVGYEVVSVLH
jgi:hypothetical protein